MSKSCSRPHSAALTPSQKLPYKKPQTLPPPAMYLSIPESVKYIMDEWTLLSLLILLITTTARTAIHPLSESHSFRRVAHKTFNEISFLLCRLYSHPSTGVIIISNCTLQCNQHYNPDLLLYVHGSHLYCRRSPLPLNIKSCPGLCNIRCIAASDIMHHQFEFATLSSSFRNPPHSTHCTSWSPTLCSHNFPWPVDETISARPLLHWTFSDLQYFSFLIPSIALHSDSNPSVQCTATTTTPLSVNSVINENPNSTATKTFNWARDDMNERVVQWTGHQPALS